MTIMNYPNDPLKLTPPMATLKCPYASTSWTCLDFFLPHDDLVVVVVYIHELKI